MNQHKNLAVSSTLKGKDAESNSPIISRRKDPLNNSMRKNALSHSLTTPSYRKWDKRLQRKDVFGNYYFPEKWETNELSSLIKFFDLQDPFENTNKKGTLTSSVKANGGKGNRRMSTSLRVDFNGNVAGDAAGGEGERRANRANRLSQSWGGGNNIGEGGGIIGGGGSRHGSITRSSLLGGLSSSITSSLKGGSQVNLAKLLADSTKQRQPLDPATATKEALNSIFFPYMHDPRSVLLKRGSVFLQDTNNNSSSNKTRNLVKKRNGKNNSNGKGDPNNDDKNTLASINPNEQREILFFTHGFIVADFVLKDAFKLFLAVSDREFLTVKSFLDYVRAKFKDMDTDGSGELDKHKLFAVFHNLGIPKYQCVLDELIHKVNKSSTMQEQAETVDCEAFYKELRGFLSESHSPRSSLTPNDHALEQVDPEVNDATCDESNGLKKLFRMFNKEDTKNTSEVKSASLFSSVLHVDCPDLFRGDGCEAQSSFTVTLLESKDEPLICLCSEPEDRDSWVDAFRACVIAVWEKSSNPGIVEARNNLGWQHIVIRSTYSSLVIMNDPEALECVLQQDNMMGSRPHTRWRDLNSADEYNGHTALHYATILGHTQCMDVLLRSGAKVTVGDRHGFSPMYHALSQRNDEAANILEKYGADRTHDLKLVIENEIRQQEEETKNDNAGSENGVGIRAFTDETSRVLNSGWIGSCEEEDENIDDMLLQAVSKLGGSSPYAKF